MLKILKETEAIIEECFKKFKSIQMNSLNESDCIGKIQEIIQKEAQSADNPYFKMLVNKL